MPRTRGTRAIWLTLAALVWSVTILVAAFTAAAYQGEGMTSNGQSFHTSATFVETNGASAAWLLTIPLLLTLATGVGLWLRHSRGSGAATTLAWSSVALLVVFSVLAAASVGVLILPVALLLAGAAALTSPGPRAPARAALRGR